MTEGDYVYHGPDPGALLAPCPDPGTGCHFWILQAADLLRHYLPREEAATLIEERLTRRPQKG
ncbi:MAG TPA: hypothetical protein VF020_18670 [Chthoniobacterales bacterium]